MQASTIFGINSYNFYNIIANIALVLYITIFLKVKPKRHALYSGIIFLILGLIGIRVLWACYDLKNRFTFEKLFRLKYGSMDLGGAYLAFPIALFIINKLFKVKYKEGFNVLIEALIIASAFAKYACYTVGCCRGISTDLPWAVQGLHPVQLYEVGIWILVYIAALLTKNRMNQVNRVCLIVISCVLIRMPIETLREDSRLFIEGGYWIAYQILVVACVIALFINNRKNLKKWLIAFMIISLVLLGVIVVDARIKIKDKKQNNNNIVPHGGSLTETRYRDKFVETREDGTVVNISEELTKTKKLNGLEITDIKLTKIDNTANFSANIKNTSSTAEGNYLIDIILFDNYGQEFDRIIGFIDTIEPNESIELNIAKIVYQFDYIFDVKFEEREK